MAKVPEALTEQKDSTTFWCRACRYKWEAEPDRTEPSTDGSPHPFDYFSTCPDCGLECREAHWIRNLYGAWLNLTGTKSPEASAQTLARIDPNKKRFNSLKHGLFAKTARYFPAAAGRYPECETCQHHSDCAESGVCLEISKIRMMVSHAMDSRDPRALADLMKDSQADLFVLLRRMFGHVFADGAVLEAPVFASTKDGYVLVKDDQGQQLIEKNEHPLLKRLIDLVQKNNLSLADLLLTPKTAEEADAMRGHLDGEKQERESLGDYRANRNKMLEQFLSGQSALDAAAKRQADPVAREAMREIETGDEREEVEDPVLPTLPGGTG